MLGSDDDAAIFIMLVDMHRTKIRED
jgi:hypothetical protein